MMNIETLLQAAQILESQQLIPPKKRSSKRDCQNSNNHTTTTNVLSPTTITSTSSILKDEQNDLNLNVHHQNSRNNQHSSLDQNDNDDDDDDDDIETSNQSVNGTVENLNRVQTTCVRDREIHNRLEKHRRAHLKDCFDHLKAEVPCQRDRKITNLQVLNLAIKYIQTLTRKEREYEKEIAFLTSRNGELQNRLNLLKTELNSEGHDVDTWLNSCTDIDNSASTCTASEAEMYRTCDDDDNNNNNNEIEQLNPISKSSDDLYTNNSEHGTKLNSYTIDSKTMLNNGKLTTRQRPRPSKRKLQSIPTTNLLQILPTSTTINNHTSRSENLLDFNVVRHFHLDDSCNLLTNINSRTKDNISLTPITDIRYDIVDMFTKGTHSNLQHHHHHQQQQQQQQQISPLPSIASLMNRHSSQPSPVVSPTKQTIGINTDPLTTSTTNILHQPVATS